MTEADIPRRRYLSNTNAQGRRREKPRDMTASRWRTTNKMSVSGSKPKFQPKPPPPQGSCRAEQNTSFQQRSRSMDIGTAPATTQTRTIQPVSAQKPETSSNTVKAVTTYSAVPNIVRDAANSVGLGLLSTDGCSTGAHEPLLRSGSAPSSSAMAITNPLGSACSSSCRPTDEKPPMLHARIKTGCSPSAPEGNFACWDERRDTTAVTPVDTVSPPRRYGSASTSANEAARSTVSERQQEEPLPQHSGPSSNSSTRSGGSKGLHSGSGRVVSIWFAILRTTTTYARCPAGSSLPLSAEVLTAS